MDLEQLKSLSELKYRQSTQALALILQRESELRTELSRLRQLVLETHAQPAEDAHVRAIGADIIWLKWVGQAQRKLNIELAQVLARKEGHMAANRRALGKKLVSEELAARAVSIRSANRQAKQLQKAIDQSLM